MKIRLYNARIVTMNEPLSIIEGELWIENDTIIYIGAAKQEIPEFDKSIDINGNLLMPGFKNAHTHSAMTFLRSFADDKSLNDWLYQDVFPHEAKLTSEDIYWLSKLAFLEYLAGGTTACFDMYMHLDGFAAAQKETGFRAVLCGSANDFGGSAESTAKEYAVYNNHNKLLSYKLGFHAEYTTNAKMMKELADLARALKEPMYLHNSETKAEVEGCMERYNTTPTAYLESIGMFEYGGGGFHCVYLSNEDISIFKKRNMHIITNPGSNTKLASGIAPISVFDSLGINLGIGTDGAASNNSLNMFKEMYLATGLQKLLLMDPKAMPADRVLHAATVGSAHAMGLENCDILEVGKQADIIEINMQLPNMQPENDIVKNLVYSGSNQNIKRTIIAGKVLYEDGSFYIGEDVCKIYAKANEIKKRICG